MKEYIDRAEALEAIWEEDNQIDAALAIGDVPAADVVEVVRCDNCILHENCLTEDTFRRARIDNPYCCVGRQANVWL